MSDSTFYSENSPDTLNPLIWKQIYEEMYYAAHDTTLHQTVATINDFSTSFYGDTIPIALMDYNFYYCKEDAINTGDYFSFDTLNDQFLDHPNPIASPYDSAGVFVGAALKEYSNFANPVYRIDPQLFFTDSINISAYQNPQSLRIDFDDETGWHYVDMQQVTHYQATYLTSGNHVIKIELLDSKGRKTKSSVNVLKTEKATPPDELLYLEGLEVGVYHGCDNNTQNRAIIYLEGIDMLDAVPAWGRGVDDIYSSMIGGPNQYLAEFRNFNYDFYVVNWEKSTIDMRFNALHVLNLIEKLKKDYDNTEMEKEQFVIIGESMGGVIARYVLSYMETEFYQKGNFAPFFQDAAHPQNVEYLNNHPNLQSLGFENRDPNLVSDIHKTRELITLDSPHQGANIPLAIQKAYRDLFGGIAPGYQLAFTMANLALESRAAKQLLLYHIDAKVSPGQNTSAYLPAPAHFAFFDQMENRLGDYPKACKIMALSSGTLTGKNQQNIFQNLRTPNDILLDSDVTLYARVLWIPMPILDFDYILRTNPNGTGTFYTAAMGMFNIDLQVKLFGVEFNNVYGNIYTNNQAAISVKPYCVSAGGYYYVPIENNTSPSNYNLAQNWLLNLFSYDLQVSNGCMFLNSHVGWQGFGSTNLDFSLCTQGFDFGFVPLQSALDYGEGLNLPLNHNIRDEAVSTKLSRTPFDVITGKTGSFNHNHLNYRDELIYNVTGSPAFNCSSVGVNGEKVYYDADLVQECEVKRSFLCLEIGDEELYLENWTLNRPARFQSEYDFYVNARNPYYEYISQTPIGNMNIYSKEAPFDISPSGHATFVCNESDSPTNIGFVYNNPQPTNLWVKYDKTDMYICVIDYAEGKSLLQGGDKDSIATKETPLHIYSNPANTTLTLDFGKVIEDELHIQLLDFTGKVVQEVHTKGRQQEVPMALSTVQSGMYWLRVTGNHYQAEQKVIVH